MNDPIPTEDEISSLLEHVQPQPRALLRARVGKATWNTSPTQTRPWLTRGGVRQMGLATLAVIGVMFVFFTIPPFNGIAQRFANFFERSDQDTLNISLTPQPPSRQFPLSLAEATSQAGFSVSEPDWVPEGFQFNGVGYDAERQTVLLDFHSPIPGNFLRLTESQTAENILNVNNVGATADIQVLEIQTPSGEVVSGEYVVGAWRIPSVFDRLQTDQPDITATMQAAWDPNAKIHMLRWETHGILFEIIHADQTLETLSAEILVKMAESIK